MTAEKKNFLKWASSISAILVAGYIVGGVIMYRAVGVLKSEQSTQRAIHAKDMRLIGNSIDRIEDNQKEMRKDIRTIMIYIGTDGQVTTRKDLSYERGTGSR